MYLIVKNTGKFTQYIKHFKKIIGYSATNVFKCTVV